MYSINRRVSYILGCVGSRCAIMVYIAKVSGPVDLYFAGVFYIFVASKFIFLDFLQVPNIESVSLRFIHAVIYLIFAFYAMRGNNNYSWKILLVDLIFGTSVYTFNNLLPILNSIIRNIINSHTETIILDL